eukprot:4967962-Prymnesium_polylepis.1
MAQAAHEGEERRPWRSDAASPRIAGSSTSTPRRRARRSASALSCRRRTCRRPAEALRQFQGHLPRRHAASVVPRPSSHHFARTQHTSRSMYTPSDGSNGRASPP